MPKKLKILLTGADGQVGHELLKVLPTDYEVIPTTLSGGNGFIQCDLSDIEKLRKLLSDVNPDIIVNPAAYTAVDKAEGDPTACFVLNKYVPREFAEYAAKKNIPLIHYSTDYVFDGSGNEPRNEEYPPAPKNVYGISKLAGEVAIELSGCHHLILRTSWVFSSHGHNFVKTMLKLGKDKEELSIVSDQIGAPTSARFLAEMTKIALDKGVKEGFDKISGTYHLCNSGETSWHGFATEIFKLAREKGVELKIKNVKPIPTSEYPTPAFRPLNSRLDCGKFKQTFAIGKFKAWSDALIEVINKLF